MVEIAKNKGGRPKGLKKPPLIIDRAKAVALAEERAKKPEKARNKMTTTMSDKQYLTGMFKVFVRGIESTIKDERDRKKNKGTDKNPDKPWPYRYTPRQMWENIKHYFRVTIEYGQPLTICGIGVFNGIGRKELFDIMNRENLDKNMYFLRDCAKFVEMYNEYAAHRKQNPAGPIFILKNFGWKDKFEIEASSTQGALSDDERAAAQKRLSEISEERRLPEPKLEEEKEEVVN